MKILIDISPEKNIRENSSCKTYPLKPVLISDFFKKKAPVSVPSIIFFL